MVLKYPGLAIRQSIGTPVSGGSTDGSLVATGDVV
jgi:hypothetical protein